MLKKIVLIVTVLSAGASMAACGGGGWKPNSKDDRLSAEDQRLLVEDIKIELDSTVIDKNSNRLGLDEKHMAAVQRAMDDIRNELSARRRMLNEARTSFRNCIGDCPNELKQLKAAYEALKNETPNDAFQARLKSILNHDQMKTYQRLKEGTLAHDVSHSGEFSSAE